MGHWFPPSHRVPYAILWVTARWPFPLGTSQLQRIQKSTSLHPRQSCPGEACLAGAAARVAAAEGP